MTFAAINWLNISINLLLVIFIFVCCLMTLIILMQRPKQEGLGAAFGGGVTDQVFGARTTDVLQRATVYLGSLFFILSLLLAVLIGQKNKTISTVTQADKNAPKVEAKAPVTPGVEGAPKSLSEELPPADTTPKDTPNPAEVPADAMPVPAPAPVPETTPAPEPTPAPGAPPAETTPSTENPPAVTPPPAAESGAPENKPQEP